jgi:hypothetical protein
VPDTSKIETVATETLAVAVGRTHRADPVVGATGGPAGNARLTAWTGLVLLALFVAELITLLDVRGLISWHLALGVALLPPALLKTATTGWRILRYYLGSTSYRRAGPPPVALRLLGPLVVAGTLALLGTGIALVLLGESRSRQTLLTVVGQRIDVLTLHQAAFAVWAVVTGLHVLARAVTAWQLTRRSQPRVPASGRRLLALVVVLGLSVALVGWVLARPDGWRDQRVAHPEGRSLHVGGR